MTKNNIVYKKKYPIFNIIFYYISLNVVSVIFAFWKEYKLFASFFLFALITIYIINLFTGTICFYEKFMSIKRYGLFFTIKKNIAYQEIINAKVYEGIRGKGDINSTLTD